MSQAIRDAAQALLKAHDSWATIGEIKAGWDALRAALSAPQTTTDDRLYCECKTDEERADFFASGRAHETGIVAASVAMDVARAFFAKSLVGEITYPAHMRKEGDT